MTILLAQPESPLPGIRLAVKDLEHPLTPLDVVRELSLIHI